MGQPRQRHGSRTACSEYTDLGRFPATIAGHVHFIEAVGAALHHAAESKRNQSARSYPDATVESTIAATKWDEARSRIRTLVGVLDAARRLDQVLARELSSGTVEQLDELFLPAVRALRDDYEAVRATSASAIAESQPTSPTREFDRELRRNVGDPLLAPATISAAGPAAVDNSRSTPARGKVKRSTVRGEGRDKLIAALTKHHKYADGGCLNLEFAGVNELARSAGVSSSTASVFFKAEFQGHEKYRAICRDAGKLADCLKALRGEFSPHELYGRRPPGEDDRDLE
jgi:hypothetical protein